MCTVKFQLKLLRNGFISWQHEAVRNSTSPLKFCVVRIVLQFTATFLVFSKALDVV
jgi:hypothetical protein